jgi:hypothetical protein
MRASPDLNHKEQSMRLMTRTLFVSLVTAGTLVVGAGIGHAAPSDQGACRQGAQDALQGASSEGTRGDFMSDVIFGNEPNMANGAPGGPEEQAPGSQAGQVLPSQSPGPFVNAGPNEPPRNDRGEQGAGGDEVAHFINSSCNA